MGVGCSPINLRVKNGIRDKIDSGWLFVFLVAKICLPDDSIQRQKEHFWDGIDRYCLVVKALSII